MSILRDAKDTNVAGSAFAVAQGDGNVIHQTITTYRSGPDGIEILFKFISPDAIHDAEARFEAPRCHPETRIVVQEDIMTWGVPLAGAVQDPAFFLWLLGAAGTGKSAIQQTIAEKLDEKKIVAASFFFSHQFIDRDNEGKLAATLAYQIALNIPDVRPHVAAAVIDNPSVFTKSFEKQVEILILEPIALAIARDPSSLQYWPKLIIIDGLDECKGEDHRLSVLVTLHKCLASGRLPFRVALASRAELPMRDFFAPSGLGGSCTRIIELNESYNPGADIRLYLGSAFTLIRNKNKLELTWPPEAAIDKLVDNASGQFIYASTVVKFVSDETQQRPKEHLQLILDQAVISSAPYAALDATYTAILNKSVSPKESITTLRIALGIRLADFSRAGFCQLTASEIDSFLQLEPSHVERLFGRLHSLVIIPAGDAVKLKPYSLYHKSLRDFLAAPSRCGPELSVIPESIVERICAQILLSTGRLEKQQRCPESCPNFVHGDFCLVGKQQIIQFVEEDQGTRLHFHVPMHEALLNPDFNGSSLQESLLNLDAEAWVAERVRHRQHMQLQVMYYLVHNVVFGCSSVFQCGNICQRWREAILAKCANAGWDIPTFRKLRSLWAPPIGTTTSVPWRHALQLGSS
ncbi:hypothetical protein FA15DRAFT_691863 [Coprinopsis marcescibilis]|uniref:Nephrocystin 3-like N-terminal domain-containing protein n=1 Tax=Coprinopsis marcescibilis TaxID=230819 RepID=A0A5C3L6Y7_COPMA|nr:hypothetical protein FA15DRAFT_691863 [Coprinopsis marcescibilis]